MTHAQEYGSHDLDRRANKSVLSNFEDSRTISLWRESGLQTGEPVGIVNFVFFLRPTEQLNVWRNLSTYQPGYTW